MSATCEAQFTGLFDQAVQTFGDALKAQVKVQEQIASFWSDALGKATPGPEWQKKQRALFGEVIPAAQKNAEEWFKLSEQNYRKSADLLKKAFECGGNGTAKELQEKTQSLWESSLELIKENVQAVAKTNAKVMELWSEVLKQNGSVTA